MELKLVYRVLRTISRWTVNGFYSEVYTEGEDNLPKDCPIIIACTHHNEIIDIATLSITIPHGRHVSFWAKSTMFNNPLMGAIMASSGAIPVRRNPNNTSNEEKEALFASTSRALARDQVVGVFPEGTSYTQPRIVQVMSGAAWAGVEYTKYKKQNALGGKAVAIVPVAIVYTNKGQFQSRVRVQFGPPISMASYDEYLSDTNAGAETDDERAKNVVKKVMEEVERAMFEMTVNAPDWETLYAACTARDILFPAEIPLKNWVAVNQRLVDILKPSDPSTRSAKHSLTKYFSLLQHTGLAHASLASSKLSVLKLPLHVLQTLLFFPTLITHVPAYIIAQLSARYLPTPGEEESEAEYKAVGGGIGLGLWLSFVWGSGLFGRAVTLLGYPQERAGLINFFGMSYVFIKLHGVLVRGNYNRYLRIRTLMKVLVSRLLPPLPASQVEPYMKLPPPPTNAFIRKRVVQLAPSAPPPPAVASHKLIPHLLKQRGETTEALAGFLGPEERKWVKTMGGVVP